MATTRVNREGVSLWYRSTSTNPPTIATQISLTLQQMLCFHSW